MKLGARFALYLANLNRSSFKLLAVPLLLIFLSRFSDPFLRVDTIEGWSTVVFACWSPLMALHIWGAGKAWDDFKRPGYPKELALVALGLNLLAPFVVIYFILYV